MFDCLERLGLIAHVTIHHFVHPAWFEDLGAHYDMLFMTCTLQHACCDMHGNMRIASCDVRRYTRKRRCCRLLESSKAASHTQLLADVAHRPTACHSAFIAPRLGAT